MGGEVRGGLPADIDAALVALGLCGGIWRAAAGWWCPRWAPIRSATSRAVRGAVRQHSRRPSRCRRSEAETTKLPGQRCRHRRRHRRSHHPDARSSSSKRRWTRRRRGAPRRAPSRPATSRASTWRSSLMRLSCRRSRSRNYSSCSGARRCLQADIVAHIALLELKLEEDGRGGGVVRKAAPRRPATSVRGTVARALGRCRRSRSRNYSSCSGARRCPPPAPTSPLTSPRCSWSSSSKRRWTRRRRGAPRLAPSRPATSRVSTWGSSSMRSSCHRSDGRS